MNAKNNFKIMVIVTVREGLKKAKVGNEKEQQCMKREIQKEEEKKKIKTGKGKQNEGLTEDH